MRPGRPLATTVTRGSLVFLLAGVAGVAFLGIRAPALVDWIRSQPPAAIALDTTTGTPATAPFADDALVLAQISVVGRRLTDPSDILDAVGVPQGSPLLAIDPARVRERLEKLPWVAEARVERRLPDHLHIALRERVPMALWQLNGTFSVIDREGRAVPVDPAAWSHLPLVVGPGAPERAAALLAMLSAQPRLAGKVVAATLIGERRWSLQVGSLENGILIRLPETAPDRALAELVRLDHEQDLLARDIEVIDMRLPDLLVVRVRAHAEETAPKAGTPGRKTLTPQRARPAGPGTRTRGQDA
ncbi:cell division protein FtsQ [Pararhodospirillum oryzae]|uniref:Cell division protein FtsQ n=1 Tax=Pararhodospirillum oryzae TaxID=478448 RepID=A0A512H8T6_9PROT|nr:FtsQ-type POTRA domain-containing protein [Pararhodospirillum oryzae]GEO81828.1 cell division protein FtsQ [Pararhodospirillum oryzae]